MLVRFRPPLERRSHSNTHVPKPSTKVSAFHSFGLTIFTVGEVAPNRSRLLVVTVGLLLAVAAIIQAVGGDSSQDPVNPETVSSSSSQGTSAADSEIGSTLVAPTNTSSTTITQTPSPSTSTTSAQYPVTSTSIGEGAVRISGYGVGSLAVGDEWSDYRTAVYRGTTPNSGLIIELRDSQSTVGSFGYSDSDAADGSSGGNRPIQGIRWLEDTTQGVKEIAVTAAAGWEIDLLPDAFLWNREIDAGNSPEPGDRFLFSAEGLTFVGGLEHQGFGDFMIYNACEGSCNEDKTYWSIRLNPDCRWSAPDLFVKEVGNPFFEQISHQDPRIGSAPVGTVIFALETYDWLQVLTPCEWTASYSS